MYHPPSSQHRNNALVLLLSCTGGERLCEEPLLARSVLISATRGAQRAGSPSLGRAGASQFRAAGRPCRSIVPSGMQRLQLAARARRRVLDRGSVLMAAHRPPARTTLPQPRVSRGCCRAGLAALQPNYIVGHAATPLPTGVS